MQDTPPMSSEAPPTVGVRPRDAPASASDEASASDGTSAGASAAPSAAPSGASVVATSPAGSPNVGGSGVTAARPGGDAGAGDAEQLVHAPAALATAGGASAAGVVAPAVEEAAAPVAPGAADVPAVAPSADAAASSDEAGVVANGATKTTWDDVLSSVVKVYATHCNYASSMPWQRQQSHHSSSSGFVVAGRRLLTNAHSVKNHVDVKVKRRDSDVRYVVRVLEIAHEADLALLAVDDDAFWEGLRPLQPGPLPNLQDRVVVCGYPVGGESVSVTSGVVSRVEMHDYVNAATSLLSIQIDAAINAGNSGGPALDKSNNVVGIAFQVHSGGQGIGYVIPWEVVMHLLDDVATHGKYMGFPTAGFRWQKLENAHLRSYKGLPSGESVGVLVATVDAVTPAAGVIHPGDVVTAVDGTAVMSAGTVPFGSRAGARINFEYLVTRKQVGDQLAVDVVRDGKPMSLSYALVSVRVPQMVPPMEFRRQPEYLIVGGLVFLALSKAYMSSQFGHSWRSSAPSMLVYLRATARKEDPDDQVVILSHVLAAPLNQGYERLSNRRLLRINGVDVTSMAQLAALVEGGEAEGGAESELPAYLVFEMDYELLVVLRREDAMAETPRLMRKHGIREASSIGPLPDVEVEEERKKGKKGMEKKGAKPEEAAPAKVDDAAPAKVDNAEPAKVSDAAPAKVGDTAPAKVGDAAPAKVGDTAPDKTGDAAPAKVGVPDGVAAPAVGASQ